VVQALGLESLSYLCEADVIGISLCLYEILC
jgi:hypothetical protein